MSKKRIITLALALAVFGAQYLIAEYGGVGATSTPAANTIEERREPYVTRVVDGDTLEIMLDGTLQKVRLVGIDTPESVDPRRPVQCFGKEATEHIKTLVEGKSVRLEIDPEGDTVDTYGRLLRYVFIGDESESINARMIRDGYAYAYTKYPFSERVSYLKIQTEARAAARGLWSSTTCAGKR